MSIRVTNPPLGIGNFVVNGIANYVPYIGANGKLAQHIGLQYDGTSLITTGILNANGGITSDDVTDTAWGIQNQNLVDKSASEIIAGAWTFNGGITMGANIAMGDNSIAGIDNLEFTDVAGMIAGIENQNLLDKTAAETISGVYTHTDQIIIGVTDTEALIVRNASDTEDVLTVNTTDEEVVIGSSTGVDDVLELWDSTLKWTIGYDQSDSGAFKIANGVLDGTNDIIRLDGTDIQFWPANALEVTIAANRMTFNAGANDPQLGWTVDGDLDVIIPTSGGAFDVNIGGAEVFCVHDTDACIVSGKELRFWDVGNSNYVGFQAPALTSNQIWDLPNADGSADDVFTTDGNGVTSWKTATVQTPVSLEMYDAEPARNSETNWNGGLLSLATGQPLDSVPTDIVVTKGIGKIMVVVNAGSDLAGDITITGETIDRNTGASTPADTDTITVDSLTTDGSTTDSNGNTKHSFTGAYITSKWFTGSVTLSTTNLTLTDVDVYHVSFEQFNDAPTLTLDTFDANIFTTNVNAEFDAYLYDLHVSGDKCDIELEAELHVGADGETAIANKYWRLRKGGINDPLNGATDGIWVDVHYSNSPSYIEDVTLKVWATCTSSVILT